MISQRRGWLTIFSFSLTVFWKGFLSGAYSELSNIEDGAVKASKAFKRQLFLLKALSYMFDRVPNTPLLLVAPLNQHYLMF